MNDMHMISKTWIDRRRQERQHKTRRTKGADGNDQEGQNTSSHKERNFQQNPGNTTRTKRDQKAKTILGADSKYNTRPKIQRSTEGHHFNRGGQHTHHLPSFTLARTSRANSPCCQHPPPCEPRDPQACRCPSLRPYQSSVLHQRSPAARPQREEGYQKRESSSSRSSSSLHARTRTSNSRSG